jgi:hypothetical protein
MVNCVTTTIQEIQKRKTSRPQEREVPFTSSSYIYVSPSNVG